MCLYEWRVINFKMAIEKETLHITIYINIIYLIKEMEKQTLSTLNNQPYIISNTKQFSLSKTQIEIVSFFSFPFHFTVWIHGSIYGMHLKKKIIHIWNTTRMHAQSLFPNDWERMRNSDRIIAQSINCLMRKQTFEMHFIARNSKSSSRKETFFKLNGNVNVSQQT